MRAVATYRSVFPFESPALRNIYAKLKVRLERRFYFHVSSFFRYSPKRDTDFYFPAQDKITECVRCFGVGQSQYGASFDKFRFPRVKMQGGEVVFIGLNLAPILRIRPKPH